MSKEIDDAINEISKRIDEDIYGVSSSKHRELRNFLAKMGINSARSDLMGLNEQLKKIESHFNEMLKVLLDKEIIK